MTKSINFEFLRARHPVLADLGAAAESYAKADPASALVKLRLFAECIVEFVYEKYAIALPYQDDLGNRINAPGCLTALGRAGVTGLNRLRRASVQGAHFGHSPEFDFAVDQLRVAFDLGHLVLRVVHEAPAKRDAFVVPPMGGLTGASKAELKRQKRDALRRAEALAAQLDEERRELEQLRQQRSEGVLAVLGGEPVGLDPEEASAFLESYLGRLRRWVDTTVGHSPVPVPVPSPSLPERMRAGRSLQLLGPSGIGKSLALVQLAGELGSDEALPVFARSALFDGDVDNWLDRAVAVYSSGSAATVLRMARATNMPVAFIVDGANECPPQHTAKLREFISSVQLHDGVAVALSARSAFVEGDAGLEDVPVGAYARDARAALFQAYASADREPPAFALQLRTPLEIRMAAECAQDLGPSPTRQGLLRAYVRRVLEGVSTPLVADRTLRTVALEMGKSLRQSMSLEQFRRIAEEQVLADGLGVEEIGEICQGSAEVIGLSSAEVIGGSTSRESPIRFVENRPPVRQD